MDNLTRAPPHSPTAMPPTSGVGEDSIAPQYPPSTLPSPVREKKCGYPQCRNKDADVISEECAFPGCKRRIHRICYSRLVKEFDPSSEAENTSSMFCTRRCLKKWKRKQTEESRRDPSKKRRVLWTADGSLAVLMNWLTTEGNYNKYVGGSKNNGRTKSSFHVQLAKLINEKCASQRTEKDVASKIASLEKSIRDASDWLSATGAGLEDPGEVRRYVEKEWPQYYALSPILSSRPNITPLHTNEAVSINNDTADNLESSTASGLETCPDLGADNIIPDITADTPVNTPRRRLSLLNSDDENPPTKKRNIGNKRFDVRGSIVRGEELIKIRQNELDTKRTEAESRKEVDVATKVKLEAEAALVKEQVKREKQKSLFENLKQRKELEKEGYSAEEINEFYGALE